MSKGLVIRDALPREAGQPGMIAQSGKAERSIPLRKKES